MKATWLLLVVVLFFGACAKTTATMPNNLAQVNVENSDDLAFLEAFDALNRNEEEVAFEKFFALYKKTGSLICAKEALKLAFVLRNDKLDLLVQVARKQMSKDSDVLRILAGYELQNLKIKNCKKTGCHGAKLSCKLQHFRYYLSARRLKGLGTFCF